LIWISLRNVIVFFYLTGFAGSIGFSFSPFPASEPAFSIIGHPVGQGLVPCRNGNPQGVALRWMCGNPQPGHIERNPVGQGLVPCRNGLPPLAALGFVLPSGKDKRTAKIVLIMSNNSFAELYEGQD
jgi:hypothetical protein